MHSVFLLRLARAQEGPIGARFGWRSFRFGARHGGGKCPTTICSARISTATPIRSSPKCGGRTRWFDHRLDAFVLTRYGESPACCKVKIFGPTGPPVRTGAPDRLRAKVEAYVDALELLAALEPFVDRRTTRGFGRGFSRRFSPWFLPVIGAATRDAVRAALDELAMGRELLMDRLLRLPRTDARAGQGVRHFRRRHRALQALDLGDLCPDRRRRRRRKRR